MYIIYSVNGNSMRTRMTLRETEKLGQWKRFMLINVNVAVVYILSLLFAIIVCTVRMQRN